MSIDLLIIRNRAKLEKLITNDENYVKILKQSQKLDKLINRKMKEKNSHIFPTLVWDNSKQFKIMITGKHYKYSI